MSTYILGDVQGCFLTLQKLLKQFKFAPLSDRIFFVGDLVNRGPYSGEVLRWAKSLGQGFTSVLGNHDLHLLSLFAGLVPSKKRDTLLSLFHAPDLEELIDWLRNCPLLFEEENYLLVHAGLHPRWSLNEARAFAQEFQEGLGSPHWKDFLRQLFLSAHDSPLRRALQIFTRIRVCHENGEPDFHYTGPPEEAPLGLYPWFAHPQRQNWGKSLFFGHWSALGFRREKDWISLDSGCVWGKTLTAFRLEDQAVFQEALRDPVQK